MKMYEVLEFSRLYDTIKDTKMPLKISYKFSRLMRQAQKEIEFYQSKMEQIIEDFAQKDSEGHYVYTSSGDSIAIQAGREESCNEAIKELQNLEIDFGNITFSLEELGALENLNLSITEIGCLMPLIED